MSRWRERAGVRRSARRPLVAVAAACLLLVAACTDDSTTGADRTTSSSASTRPVGSAGTAAPEALGLGVVARHPHDTGAFTEGLLFDEDGRLFESVGLEGESALREVDPDRGTIVRDTKLPADQFGEGIALGAGGIVQLTWKNGVAHRWSIDDGDGFGRLGSFRYDGEGWGLTTAGSEFVQSDGSPTLKFRDGTTFEVTRSVEVTRAGQPVDEVNELESVDGVLYANVWHSDEILRIDPASGRVTGVVDASSLWRDPARTSEMTLNGIAHRPGDPPDRLWLTGKNWPEMFVVDVVPARAG